MVGQDIKMPSSDVVQSNNNIFIGDEIEIQGAYNVVLGDFVKSYDAALPDDPDNHIDRNLIISAGLVQGNLPKLSTGIIMISPGGFTDNAPAVIPSRSIIFGDGITPSTQPKLQFGGANLLYAVP